MVAFDDLPGHWMPVALSRSLRRRPMAIDVAGQTVAVFRRPGGSVAALLDRCPHRGAPLSRGRVTDTGQLECPFHGWCFEADGSCSRAPLNDEAALPLKRMAATSVPVREAGGLLWLFTGVESDAGVGEPTVPEALSSAEFTLWHQVVTWKTHWTRAMENMLDAPHLPYVHRSTIGRGLRAKMRPDSVMDVRVEKTATGFRSTWTLDGEPSPTFLDWLRPNGMCLHLPVPGRVMRIHVWCVPVDAESTRMVVVSARNFGRFNPFARLFDELNRVIVAEDRAVVEGSSPSRVPHPSEEVSVPTDRATLAFRQWFLRQSRPGHPAALAEDAPRRGLRVVTSEIA